MVQAIDKDYASAKPELVIGVMSGTSLDGLDICAVELSFANQQWKARIVESATVKFPGVWTERLHAAFAKTADQLTELSESFGDFIGAEVAGLCVRSKLNPSLIASHGHTIHHQPDIGYTLQIGDGARIAATAQVPCVSNFRIGDVALGGQGAPLVPIADAYLYGEYEACLNLGGYANVSYTGEQGQRLAYDIAPVNALLNPLANMLGMPYDRAGAVARGGQVKQELATHLRQLAYYSQAAPKSLGREWLEHQLWPLVQAEIDAGTRTEDLLATATSHIVEVISDAVLALPVSSHAGLQTRRILITGGGAYNTFLIDSLRQNLTSSLEVVLPKGEQIEFKEAVAFALLGALRMRGETNILASVTGASRDSCGGDFAEPPAH